jgi:diacylglycerol kinase (ATP)
MRKGLLIHNLKAGSLDVELLPRLVSALGEVISVDIEQLGEAGDALQYAEANHCDWIAVAGGDGTVESVASNLVGTAFPFGIIPAGTFNNFARSLGLPLDPIEACHVIRAGNARPTDVRFANGKPFFECLGAGLGAIAFRVAKLRVDGPRKLPVHLDGSPKKDLWPFEAECKEGALLVFRKAGQ